MATIVIGNAGNSLVPSTLISFATLSSNAWDFTTGAKRKMTLAANTAITITGNVVGQSVAILSVTQDATGSRTLSINGTAITINTAANINTLVAIIDLGGGLFAFDTNVGIATSGVIVVTSTETPITFGFFAGGLSAAGTVITSTTGTYATNLARAATLKILGDAYVAFELVTATDYDTVLGVNSLNANTSYGGMQYFVWKASTGNYYTGHTGANVFDTGVVGQVGDRVRLIRTAGVVVPQYFRGGVWTNLPYNGTPATTTVDLFIVITGNSPSKISNISGFNLTAI